jgi:hypothetical protein
MVLRIARLPDALVATLAAFMSVADARRTAATTHRTGVALQSLVATRAAPGFEVESARWWVGCAPPTATQKNANAAVRHAYRHHRLNGTAQFERAVAALRAPGAVQVPFELQLRLDANKRARAVAAAPNDGGADLGPEHIHTSTVDFDPLAAPHFAFAASAGGPQATAVDPRRIVAAWQRDAPRALAPLLDAWRDSLVRREPIGGDRERATRLLVFVFCRFVGRVRVFPHWDADCRAVAPLLRAISLVVGASQPLSIATRWDAFDAADVAGLVVRHESIGAFLAE